MVARGVAGVLDPRRAVIEHLRSGVPSPQAADLLVGARERLVETIEQDLVRLAEGTGARHMQVIAGNYGDGKSHLLQALWQRARRAGWLVSYVSVSREAPLDQIERVYRKVAARTYMPGLDRPGIGPLLETLVERPAAAERLLRFAARELHAKVRVALEARLEGRGDPQIVEEDLAGYRHSNADVRRAYQERVGRAAPRIDRYRVVEHAIDYFRLLDAATAALDMPGWLVLFDEVEMIGSLQKRGRALSYATMAEFIDGVRLPHTYSVWAMASNFRNELLAQDESGALASWLVEKGQTALAERIVAPLQALRHASVLPKLTDEALAQAFDTIIELHAGAMAWTPPFDGAALLERIRRQLPERDAKVRQLVRASVQYLDLTFVYGEEPRLTMRALGEAAAMLPADPEDDLGADENVRRDWPED
jgi:hypothetical protein